MALEAVKWILLESIYVGLFVAREASYIKKWRRSFLLSSFVYQRKGSGFCIRYHRETATRVHTDVRSCPQAAQEWTKLLPG